MDGGGRGACAICKRGGEGVAELQLTAGVVVWLCAAHRRPEFRSRDGGRALTDALTGVWRSAGCLTTVRVAALDRHRARLRPEAAVRARPGSYGWAHLRREAEAAFADGEPPREVIERLRARESGGTARPPSARTMQRWFRERRWDPGPWDAPT